MLARPILSRLLFYLLKSFSLTIFAGSFGFFVDSRSLWRAKALPVIHLLCLIYCGIRARSAGISTNCLSSLANIAEGRCWLSNWMQCLGNIVLFIFNTIWLRALWRGGCSSPHTTWAFVLPTHWVIRHGHKETLLKWNKVISQSKPLKFTRLRFCLLLLTCLHIDHNCPANTGSP